MVEIRDIEIELYRKNRKYRMILTIDENEIKGLPENVKYDEFKKYVLEKCYLILPAIRKFKFRTSISEEYASIKGYSRVEDDY